MSMLTESEARRKICAPSNAAALATAPRLCAASGCLAWRWQPLQADAAFMAAVKALEDAGTPKAKAGKMVHENPDNYGLPTKPFRGWCGLAGKPEVAA